MLREKRGVELGSERHQLRLDSFQARRGSQRPQHFRQQALGDRPLRVLRGHEKSADQSLVILEDVEAIAGGLAVRHRRISAQSARIDEFAHQIDGRTIVPVQFIPPALGLLPKEVFQRPRMDLPEVNNLHAKPRTPPAGIIASLPPGTQSLPLWERGISREISFARKCANIRLLRRVRRSARA